MTLIHKKIYPYQIIIILILTQFLINCSSEAQSAKSSEKLDDQVKSFLKENQDNWHNWNVPYEDGQTLYNLIVKNKYTRALEIGTSTGHSTIWMAWAMSKTGGKIITIEIDKERHEKALENFKKAGVSKFIDARLANAHELVYQLKGPFDFVFMDADKEWYIKYFQAIDPKLEVGGCFTAHNILRPKRKEIQDYYNYVKGLKNYKTTLNQDSMAGLSISYKLRNSK